MAYTAPIALFSMCCLAAYQNKPISGEPTYAPDITRTAEATESPPSENASTHDNSRSDAADNSDDQPIAPRLGNQSSAMQEAKEEAINGAHYNAMYCIDRALKMMPGNATRGQAKQSAISICAASYRAFLDLARRYGEPDMATYFQGQYENKVDDEITKIYGPPQSNF